MFGFPSGKYSTAQKYIVMHAQEVAQEVLAAQEHASWHKKLESLLQKAARSYKPNGKTQKAEELSGFNRNSSWLGPMFLVQRADDGLCFPKHESLPKRRDIMLSFFMGNI